MEFRDSSQRNSSLHGKSKFKLLIDAVNISKSGFFCSYSIVTLFKLSINQLEIILSCIIWSVVTSMHLCYKFQSQSAIVKLAVAYRHVQVQRMAYEATSRHSRHTRHPTRGVMISGKVPRFRKTIHVTVGY